MKIHKIFNDFVFAEAPPGSPSVFDIEPSLFHSVKHLNLQRSSDWVWYYAQDQNHNRIVASLYLNVTSHRASSAIRSPFGTIECSEDFPPEALYEFLQFVESACINKNIESIVLQDTPAAYAPRRSALLSTFLINLGYHITRAEVTACINVKGEYEDGLNAGERPVLQKSRLAGLTFGILPNDELDRVYKFIAACHQLKGYALSMSYPELQRTVIEFQDRFVLSCVFDKTQIISASVAIRISTSILYNFYMDHDVAYNKLSPPLMLIGGLYQFCKDHSIALLDLGTSALDGQPNFSLLAFKLRTGGFPSAKLRFQKMLKA